MIEWISNWAETIIIAVIIATIIEMILPESGSKKYVKVVIGIYILFTIVSPVISGFTGNSLAVSDALDIDKYIEEVKEKEANQNLLDQENATTIRDIYIGNLKADIQNKLKGKGYEVTSIELDVGYDDNYTLNKITLWVTKEEENNTDENITNEMVNEVTIVNEININISDTNVQNNTDNQNETEENKKSNLSNSDKNKIKEYLSSVYEINEKNIVIK